MSRELGGLVDTGAIWAGTADYSGTTRTDHGDPDVWALSVCRSMEANPDHFVDVHCNVFTPDSFLNLFQKLTRLGLLDFEIAHFAPTEVNTLEFFVSLRLLDSALGREEVLRRQQASIRVARATQVHDCSQLPVTEGPSVMMEVSKLEQRSLAFKRRTFEATRAMLRKILPFRGGSA